MGAKNLKAIAVSGCTPATVADAPAFDRAVAVATARLKEHYVYYRRLAAYGTGAFVRVADRSGALPTRDYREGRFPEAAAISGEAVADTILERTTACFGCPVGCGRLTAVDGLRGAGPEYEHLTGFGSNCGVADLATIAKAAYACHEDGLDAAALATAISGLMATAGDPGFGDGGALSGLVEQAVSGKGFGALLRQGRQAVAAHSGRPEVVFGETNEAAGGHCVTAADAALNLRDDLLIAEDGVGRPRLAAGRTPHVAAVVDAAGLCPLVAATFSLDELAALLSAATGTGYSDTALRECGAAIRGAEGAFGRPAGAGDDN
jgi:aldehyde:ferredoxin oxidoreductase